MSSRRPKIPTFTALPTRTDWRDRAECQAADARLFWFTVDANSDRAGDRETTVQRDERHREAVTVCAACPVFDQCLIHAQEDPTAEGVYAGKVFQRQSPSTGYRPAVRDVPKGPRVPGKCEMCAADLTHPQARVCGRICRRAKDQQRYRNRTAAA